MRFIPTGVHAVMDYLMGIILIGAPFVFAFGASPAEGIAANNAATYVPVVLGFGVIIYSLLTNYELGLIRKIPMRGHLALDAGSGLLLAVSPWLFGFAHIIWLPHVILGLIEIGAAALTDPEPFRDRAAAGEVGGRR